MWAMLGPSGAMLGLGLGLGRAKGWGCGALAQGWAKVTRPGRRLLMSIPNILAPTGLVGGTGSDPSGAGLEPAWGGL